MRPENRGDPYPLPRSSGWIIEDVQKNHHRIDDTRDEMGTRTTALTPPERLWARSSQEIVLTSVLIFSPSGE